MKVALLQTKQNRLYHFIDEQFLLDHSQAVALREEMVAQCFDLAKGAVGQNCDLIVTSEAVNFCGREQNLIGEYSDFFPLYPGDGLFDRFSALAKEAGAWLVAGVYHKRYDGKGIPRRYNSAFIYNREGELMDIYDKIHLAGTENDSLTAGNRCVTVKTDMGVMGVAICFDMQFPDVCGTCKALGADFMAVSTWGWEHGYGLERIRETGLKMAVAMAVPYWMPIQGPRSPSELLDGNGNVLAAAGRQDAQILLGEF